MQHLIIIFYSFVIEVSIGLAGCGAGIAGLINLSLVLRWGGAGGLLEPTLCRAEDTQAAVNNWPQAGHLGGPTIRESRGDGACIDDKPKKETVNFFIKDSFLNREWKDLSDEI